MGNYIIVIETIRFSYGYIFEKDIKVSVLHDSGASIKKFFEKIERTVYYLPIYSVRKKEER